MSEDSDKNLKRLSRELYSREEGSEITLRRRQLTALGTPAGADEKSGIGPAKPQLANMIKRRVRRRRKLGLIIFFVILAVGMVIAAVAGTIQYRLSRQVKTEQIGIGITGPTEITAGDAVTYSIQYKNDSRVAWQSVELLLQLPAGFTLEKSEPALTGNAKEYQLAVGNLAAGEGREVVVSGRLLGEQNATSVTQAEIVLSPENFPSGRFTKTAVASTVITAVPIEVSVEAVTEAATGERVPVAIHVRNLSGMPIEGAYLTLQLQPGMQLLTEDSEFSPGFSLADTEWLLPTIEPLTAVTRQAIVLVEGSAGESRPIEAVVGLQPGEERFMQRRVTHVVNVVASELAVTLAYNDTSEPFSTSLSQSIQGRLQYQNTGSLGLRNVVAQVTFEGEGIDVATLKLESGAYNPSTRTITWSAASVPALGLVQPGESGILSYSFSMVPLEKLPTQGEDLTKLTLISTATVDSADLKIGSGQERRAVSDRMILPLKSNLTLESTAFYDDGRLGITSSGPLPPQVNKTTTYTIRLRLGSTTNDAGDMRVVSVLPDGVNFTNKTFLTSGNVTFDERSREVIWTLPQLNALTGRLAPPEELHFQVGITPGENLRGRSIQFLNLASAEGQDLFVDELIKVESAQLPSTLTVDRDKGTVQ